MKEEVVFRTEDHPQANERQPREGDVGYTLRFPLEDGRELVVHIGQKGYETMGQFLIDMMVRTPSYGDGSTNAG